MTKVLEAVIFDFDGVIADTVSLYYEATKRIAEELNVPFSIEDNLRFQGIPRTVLIEELVSRSNVSLSDEEKILLGNKKSDYYKEMIADFTEEQMLPGMKDFLSELKANGIKLAIASSSSNAPFLLEKFGVRDWFTCIVDPHSLKKGKPDPEIFLTAADLLDVEYKNCAAIEDGEAGLSGIMQTPMFSVGVGEEDYLQKADWHVKSTKELQLESLLKKFMKNRAE
ncbi:beta-phosphoglucomutase [Niallia sp. 01092]|uniref:beta-phosphoglucomutase n=1 Tax=unclassified Niallia TaxID=2837522 RepID=UPI003FD06C91